MEDTYRDKGLRKRLVEELKFKGITDSKVLESIGKIPRHFFMESAFIKFSYKDQAFPIASGQTISQPYTVAFQTQLLQVQEFQKVLEVGTGSGYQAAVLIEMKVKLFTIERHKELYLRSQALLTSMGYDAMFFYGDGYEGKSAYGPYDRILITAAAPTIPEKLLQQLKVGGRLVVPVGGSENQVMTLIERKSETEFEKSFHGKFAFVPMLKGLE